ncbi:hypothetical protein J7I94_29185 [Streptomyces sp. ISL-12]|uniref:hypothetical protein n=1 Tax=Streptomyces sp. ISL-12 TaxID=2819177 RepID=UPI001BEA5936|nr:hypothetical protein [Streptomyces sp. ISL-12]MBT2414575.1 hypothetical protein [Streptomyces sp. ISL-12]
MSDVTRPTGGAPAEHGQHPTGTPGRHPTETPGQAPGTGPALDPDAPPGAPADHTAGARAEAAPRLRTEGTRPATGTPATGTPGPGTPLLPHEECDKLEQRLHHAVSGFVDAPRAAVEEADRVLEEITSRFTDAVTRRRRTLRASWQSADTERQATAADTEQLRLALRDYRELSENLMRL